MWHECRWNRKHHQTWRKPQLSSKEWEKKGARWSFVLFTGPCRSCAPHVQIDLRVLAVAFHSSSWAHEDACPHHYTFMLLKKATYFISVIYSQLSRLKDTLQNNAKENSGKKKEVIWNQLGKWKFQSRHLCFQIYESHYSTLLYYTLFRFRLSYPGQLVLGRLTTSDIGWQNMAGSTSKTEVPCFVYFKELSGISGLRWVDRDLY